MKYIVILFQWNACYYTLCPEENVETSLKNYLLLSVLLFIIAKKIALRISIRRYIAQSIGLRHPVGAYSEDGLVVVVG